MLISEVLFRQQVQQRPGLDERVSYAIGVYTPWALMTIWVGTYALDSFVSLIRGLYGSTRGTGSRPPPDQST